MDSEEVGCGGEDWWIGGGVCDVYVNGSDVVCLLAWCGVAWPWP